MPIKLVNHFAVILKVLKSQKSKSTKKKLIKMRTCLSCYKLASKLRLIISFSQQIVI